MAAAKKTAQEATQAFEAMAADTQKAAKEQFDKLTASVEKVTAFNQETVDAVVKSSEIAAKAVEGIGSEVSAYSKKAFEDGVAAAQDFAAAKNVTELFEKQTAFAKAYFEGAVKQATKMNDMFAATAKDVTKPMNDRVAAATEAMKSFSA